MVEVFKTNITDRRLAIFLVAEIRKRFSEYTANFDLEDCDRILRVKSSGTIEPSGVINLLINFGCCADILTGDDESIPQISEHSTNN